MNLYKSNNDGHEYDVAVVGAGHAGCEAALASARMGLKTIVFCISLDSVANMPCNPNIGGTSKGCLVRETDALGGEIGKAADATTLSSRMLNRSKGPAVHSLRAQIDRRAYQKYMKAALENQKNLDLRQAEIVELIVDADGDGGGRGLDSVNQRITGVRSHTGATYNARAVVLATGTYLNARVIIGEYSRESGPDGLFPAVALTDSLRSLGIATMRFKTGTPARVNGRSLDYSLMELQTGDDPISPFSFETERVDAIQAPCWITGTNANTHEIIRANLSRSPLFSGVIEGVGARYCPSIEDKVVRFAGRASHQIFVEPTGDGTSEMYLAGFSSSMPEDVQEAMIRSVDGLGGACVMRSAYAIEYDCIDPTQLRPTLEFTNISGLFTAGQINGTSGYEEAAAQGLLAGVNAALYARGESGVTISRQDGYLGVMVDDLVTKGVSEPYRMMTSRAEYRLLLRQDNADERLTPVGRRVGLISDARYARYTEKRRAVQNETQRLEKTYVQPADKNLVSMIVKRGGEPLRAAVSLADLLRRPGISYADVLSIDPGAPERELRPDEAEQLEISVKYAGYIERQKREVERAKKFEKKTLPKDADYAEVRGLSVEAAQSLNRLRPESVGQAARITGVSPADLSVLLVWLARHGR